MLISNYRRHFDNAYVFVILKYFSSSEKEKNIQINSKLSRCHSYYFRCVEDPFQRWRAVLSLNDVSGILYIKSSSATIKLVLHLPIPSVWVRTQHQQFVIQQINRNKASHNKFVCLYFREIYISQTTIYC